MSEAGAVARNSEEVGSDEEQLLAPDAFEQWYREREYRKNIENGTPYFNGPTTDRPPERHSPSQLLQCHRKTAYRRGNAPEEDSDPSGIFWIGSRFEEELAVPFLRDVVAGPGEYVTNSVWIDDTIETRAGSVRIKGETDPVIVDDEGTPMLLTEIKTKRSVDSLESPNEHHRAQVHAYMHGLSEKYDRELTSALLLYASRTTLDVVSFRVEFDSTFWRERVLDWAATQTEYQLEDELPPPAPEQSWECRYCSYRIRCGKETPEHGDYGLDGFVPGVADYPRASVEEHLEAHPDAELTPTLADRYPELAQHHDVARWVCTTCETRVDRDAIEDAESPLCPHCAADGTLSSVSLRTPGERQSETQPTEDAR